MNKALLGIHFLKTFFLYRPFFKRAGKRIIICDPIFITPKCITMGSRIFVRHFARIEGVSKYLENSFEPILEIEDGVSIEQNAHITFAGRIFIGANTAIASNVTISDIIHPHENIALPPERQPIRTAGVTIGKNCKIYNNSVILPGTTLGNHNIVAANSVVSGSYPDYCVIAGAPARIVKIYDVKTNSWIREASSKP